LSPVISLVQEVDVIVATENNISVSVISELADTLAGLRASLLHNDCILTGEALFFLTKRVSMVDNGDMKKAKGATGSRIDA